MKLINWLCTRQPTSIRPIQSTYGLHAWGLDRRPWHWEKRGFLLGPDPSLVLKNGNVHLSILSIYLSVCPVLSCPVLSCPVLSLSLSIATGPRCMYSKHLHISTHTHILSYYLTIYLSIYIDLPAYIHVHTFTLVISMAMSAWRSYSWVQKGPVPGCWLRIALPPGPSQWSCSTLAIFDMQKTWENEVNKNELWWYMAGNQKQDSIIDVRTSSCIRPETCYPSTKTKHWTTKHDMYTIKNLVLQSDLFDHQFEVNPNFRVT